MIGNQHASTHRELIFQAHSFAVHTGEMTAWLLQAWWTAIVLHHVPSCLPSKPVRSCQHWWYIRENDGLAAAEMADRDSACSKLLAFQDSEKLSALVAMHIKSCGRHLTLEDLQTVEGKIEWLNDAVIDAFMNLIELRDGPKVACMSSYLWTCAGTDWNCGRTRMFSRRFVRWFKSVNFNAVERIFIPVNPSECHWVTIAADVLTRTLYYFDPNQFSTGGPSNNGPMQLVRQLLQLCGQHFGHPKLSGPWSLKYPDVRKIMEPQRDNSACGVLAVTFADFCASGHSRLGDVCTWKESAARPLPFEHVWAVRAAMHRLLQQVRRLCFCITNIYLLSCFCSSR
jgi:hypothetical protein